MNEDRNIDPAIGDLLSQHALQGLDADSAAHVQQLLADDPVMAHEARQLQRIVDLLPLTTQCAPPPGLRARVLAAAAQITNTHPQTSIAAPPRDAANVLHFKPRRWPLVASISLAAAASLACAVLVIDRANDRDRWANEKAGLQRQLELETQAAAALLEPNIVLSFPLDARVPASAASGYVLLDLDARRASIAVHDLPAAPPGHAYHLWAVLESKNVACGRFTPEADGRILMQFAIPVDSYTSPIQKLILTVQPDSDEPMPRGTTIMSS